MDNFKPKDEEERKWVEQYNKLSQEISEKIRGLNEKDRLAVLKDINPSSPSLMNLYFQSLKQEDYETSAVAKKLLLERGFEIPNQTRLQDYNNKSRNHGEMQLPRKIKSIF